MPSDELKAAFINAHVAMLNCRVAGMYAENAHRLYCGDPITHGEESFIAVQIEFEPVLGHNAIIAYFQEIS